jgi:hypothetical protein
MNKDLYPTLHPQVAVTLADDQVVIVLADSGQVIVLNELGTQIWQKCDGKHSIGQIMQEIIDEYDVELLAAEADIVEFLKQMVGIQALVLMEIRETGKF